MQTYQQLEPSTIWVREVTKTDRVGMFALPFPPTLAASESALSGSDMDYSGPEALRSFTQLLTAIYCLLLNLAR